MKRLLGDPKQLGIVVRDLQKTLDHWINDLGVGPWFVSDPVPFISCDYYGERMRDTRIVNALGHSGEWQIELVEPQHAGPSVWKDFLDSGGEGLHHFSHYSQDFDATMKAATDKGLVIAQNGDLASGRYAYLAHPAMKTTYYEVGEWSQARQDIFDKLKNLSSDWDGKAPIRDVAL